MCLHTPICNYVRLPRLMYFLYMLSRRNDTNLSLVGEMIVGEMRVDEKR